jgi:hypothetical protein
MHYKDVRINLESIFGVAWRPVHNDISWVIQISRFNVFNDLKCSRSVVEEGINHKIIIDTGVSLRINADHPIIIILKHLIV